MLKYLIPTLIGCAASASGQDAVLVKDLIAGVGDSNPSAVVQAADQSYIFSALNNSARYGLYATDGSTTGTVEIDLAGARIPGSTSVGGFPLLNNVNSGTTTFFLAGTAATGAELWKYASGSASLVKDLESGANSAFAPSGNGLTDATLEGSGTLGGMVFKARISGTEAVYVTNGTSAGTQAIADGIATKILGTLGGVTYFVTSTGAWAFTHADAIGASNPAKISTTLTTTTAIARARLTADKTAIIALRSNDAYGVSGSSVSLLTTPNAGKQINSLPTSIGNKFYFLIVPTDTTVSGAVEVWEATGTTASKTCDLTIATATYASLTLSSFGSNLAITAIKTDLTTDIYTGTSAGLVLAKSFVGPATVASAVNATAVWIVKGPITATTDDGIWITASTGVAPTRLIASTLVKSSGYATQPSKFGFVANDGGGKYTPFVTDGTSGGTIKYTGDFTLTSGTTDYLSLPANDSALFFAASSTSSGREPWVTTTSGSLATPTVTGNATPTVGVANIYQISLVSGATAYQYRVDGGAVQTANTDGTFSYTASVVGSHVLEGRAVAGATVGTYGSLTIVASAAATTGGSGTGTGSGTGSSTGTPSASDGGGGGGCGAGTGMAVLLASLLMVPLRLRTRK